MERVKYYANFVDLHWIAVIATGLYTHLRQICVIGLCFEKDFILPMDPSYGSVLFVFSVLCLLAEYRLWPVTLKEPPIQLLYIYEMLVAALSTNLATHIVWIPLTYAITCLTQESSRWLVWLNHTVGLDSYSFLSLFAQYMDTESAAMHMTFCMSLLSFLWMLDATESLDNVLDTWKIRHVERCRCMCISIALLLILQTKLSPPFIEMARILYTIWALILNRLGMPIFYTCFANAMEDEEGQPWLSSPPITSFLFAMGTYIIIVNSTLFPQYFRKPKAVFMCLYEFLVTVFLLEFAIACIWTPIDVHILSTLPRKISHMLHQSGLKDAAETVNANKSSMTLLTNGTATTFFLVTLYITNTADFTILKENGLIYFLSHLRTKLWQRMRNELSEVVKWNKCNNRCGNRRTSRNKNRANRSR